MGCWEQRFKGSQGSLLADYPWERDGHIPINPQRSRWGQLEVGDRTATEIICYCRYFE